MPTFFDLPLELRREVYSYFLLDSSVFNVDESFDGSQDFLRSGPTHGDLFPGMRCVSSLPMAKFDRQRLPRLNFCTSLFTTNKRLSEESLQYFYTENKFVLFCCDLRGVGRYASRLIPLVSLDGCPRKDTKFLIGNLPVIVSMSFKFKGQCRISGFGTSLVVFAARHLETFAMILNYWHFTLGKVPKRMWIEVDIEINLRRGKYVYTAPNALQEGRGIASTIVNGFKHLKRFCDPTTTIWTIYPDITGDLPKALAESIADSLQQPKGVESLMANCQFALQQGNELRDSGEFHLGTLWHFFAVNLYRAAFKTYLKEEHPKKFGPDIFNLTEQIGITARMVAGGGNETEPVRRDYELDVYAKRLFSAAIAFSKEYYAKGFSEEYYAEEAPPRLLGRLHAHLGQVFVDLKAPSRAHRQFDIALDYLPHDADLLAKVMHFEQLAHQEREDAMLGFREFYSRFDDQSDSLKAQRSPSGPLHKMCKICDGMTRIHAHKSQLLQQQASVNSILQHARFAVPLNYHILSAHIQTH